jgi:hypothetical protein
VTGQFLLFHLPKSRAAELKKMATPEDGSYWISSYDAYATYIWRMLSKHRAKLFKPDMTGNLVWGRRSICGHASLVWRNASRGMSYMSR